MIIDTLNALQGQQKIFDNGSARVTEAKVNHSDQFAQEITSAIYHKDEPVLPANHGTYNLQGRVTSNMESPEDMMDRTGRVQNLFAFGIAEQAVDLELGYQSSVKSLSSELKTKDWGFSIQDGELTVIEGADELTSDERSQIARTLKENGVGLAAQSVANAVIEMVELERGPDGVSKGIGRFDVNQSNFADIVDLRTFIGDYQPDAKYGKGRVNPSDIEGRYFGAGTGIMDQVVAKADETFLRRG